MRIDTCLLVRYEGAVHRYRMTEVSTEREFYKTSTSESSSCGGGWEGGGKENSNKKVGKKVSIRELVSSFTSWLLSDSRWRQNTCPEGNASICVGSAIGWDFFDRRRSPPS